MRRCAALAVLVALLAAGAVAGPSGQRTEHRCAAYCLTPEHSKFSYTPGQTYIYSYRSNVVTALHGSTDDASRLHVTATAEIAANSACDFTLRLRDVTLSESDPANANNKRQVDDMATFKQELERHPLSFSYQDGRVEELCATQAESVWALNFKRGLLSATVNNMESFQHSEDPKYEMDVSGYCSTGYIVRQIDNSTVVTRQKDLHTCRERGRLISSLQTTPYHSASKVQSLPLLRSWPQQCTQTVSAGRLRSAVCQETHQFQPFSQYNSGAATSTYLELTEVGVRPTVPTSGDEVLTARGSVMFDHSPAALTARGRPGEARRLLSELERLSADDVRPEVPHLFTQLVATLREVDTDDLGNLLATAAERPRRYLLDSLPMLGTAAGMAAMRDLIVTGGASTEQSDRWMTSLALVHEPRLAMVEAVAPLLATGEVRSQTLLGVSSLLYRFCRSVGDCARHTAVMQVVTSIEKLLGTGCATENQEGRTRVLAALKALGNVGLLVHGGDALAACYKEQGDIEIRLAAIRAYRRMSCDAIGDSGLMSTLANQRESTEVRIAAYLAIMQCPSHEVVDKLLELLSKETLNQVGSFIWTHITNLQESNDPSKSYVRSLLYNVELSKKFNTDARKFSRYYEKTLFFESVNAGGSVEGTVIFSPDSYIPRSGMLNLTVDLFGDAINLLEVGVRVEGLENYIESLFGSDGLYPQAAFNQVLNTIRGRASSNDISRLSDVYNQAKADADLFSASTYAKIFGNELHFANYDDLDDLIHSLGADDQLSFLQTLGRDRDWTENYQFLDSSYTVPTIAGLPLKLQAVGSAAVTLKTGGSFSVESWNKVNIEGYVKPSAAIEVVSEMGVSAHIARTGLKMSANLHSSTVLDGQVVVDSGKLVSVKINMPRDKMEIFDVKTRFHSVYRNKDRPVLMNQPGYSMPRQYGDCSHAYIGDPLGLNVCFNMSYPLPTGNTPKFPLSGPLTASITVEKTEPSINGLTLEYLHSNQDGVRKSSLMFDTPGSLQSRLVRLEYMVNIPRRAFRVGLVTPMKSLELSGDLNLRGVEKHAAVQLRLDDSEVFGISGSLTTDDSVAAVHYRPVLVIRGTAGPVFSLSGNLVVKKDEHKYAFDMTVTDLYEKPVALQGSVDKNDGMYSISTSMSSYALTGTLTGTYQYSDNNLLIQTLTEYSLLGGPRHTIAVSTKMTQDTIEAQTINRLSVDTKVSALPILDTELTLELVRSPGERRARAMVLRGQQQYLLSAEIGDQHGRRSGQIAFQADHLDIDFKLALDLDMSIRHKFQLNTLAQLQQDRFARGSLVVDYLSESYNFNYGIGTNVTLMNSNYLLTIGVRRDKDSSDFTFVASRTSPEESKTISLVSAVASDGDGVHQLDVTLRLPAYPTTRLSGQLVAGVGGRYLASGELRHGQRSYLASAQYSYAAKHVLELRAHLPDRQYAGILSVRTEGGSYKVKADLRLGRRIITVFSLRPGREETAANFELFWDKDVDDTQSIIADVRKTSYQVNARLRYPGRDMKLLAGLTPRGVQATLELSPLRIISVEGTVDVEDGNRLAAKLAVRTPFPGYSIMELTYRNKPDAADERSLLNFQVAGHIEQQEVILNGRLVVDFNGLQGIGSAVGNTLKVELDLTTPFVGWERSQLICAYFQDANSFSARTSASKNDDVTALGVVFEKHQTQDAFRISTAADFALPVDQIRDGKIDFDLAITDSQLYTDTVVEWTNNKLNELSMSMQCDYNMTSGVRVDTLVTLKTPFENMEQLNVDLKVSKDDVNLSTALTVKRNATEELLHAHLNTSGDRGPSSFYGNFDFACAGCPGFGAALDYRSAVEHSGFNITAHWKDQETTVTGAARTIEGGGQEYFLKLLLPNPIRRYHVKTSSHVDFAKKIIWNSFEISRDNETVNVDLSSTWTVQPEVGDSSSYTLKGEGKVTSPFLGWESARISHIGTLVMSNSSMKFSNNIQLHKENKNIAISQSGQFNNWTSWVFAREITSNTGWFSHATELMKVNVDGTLNEVSFRTAWDGQTAQLALVEIRPADGDYDASLTAQWFGQPTRSLVLLMPSTSSAWTPSLTLKYAPGKTIKMHGSIAVPSQASESYLTIETPFSDVILLKANHDLRQSRKHAAVELVHGEERYSLQVEVDTDFPAEASFAVKFQSPSHILGPCVLSMSYHLASSFMINGEASCKNWKVSLSSNLGKDEGSAEITTPLTGFTTLSLAYARSSKDVRLSLSRERRTYSVVLTDKSNHDTLEFTAQINTPHRGYERLTMTFIMPPGKSFSIQCQQNRRNTLTVSGHYELSGPHSHVRMEIQTAFAAFRNAKLELSYSLIKPTIKLLFIRTGDEERRMQVEATTDFNIASPTMLAEYQNNGLIFRPRSITMRVTYNVQEPEKRLVLQLLDDKNRYALEGRAKLSEDSSYMTLNVDSPIPGYEAILVSSKAFSFSSGPKVMFEITKNNQTIEAKFELDARRLFGKALFEMKTPFVVNRHIMLSAEYKLTNRGKIELIAEKDSIRKTILGMLELSYSEREECSLTTLPIDPNDTRRWRCTEVTVDALLTTPFHGLEKFVVEGRSSVVNTTSQSKLVLRLNQEKMEIQARSQLGWSNSMLSVGISTPLASARTISLNTTYDVRSRPKTAFVILSKNGQHFELTGSGTVQRGAANGYVAIRTPFASWQDVRYSAMYDLNAAEKQMEISYERNGQKQILATRGFYDASSLSFDAVTPFKGFEAMGMSGRLINNREKREIGYEAHFNEQRHRLYVLYERDGKDNVKLRLNTPIHGMHAVEVDLRKQSFSDGVGIYLDTSIDGKRSSAEIRTSLGKTTMGIDVGIQSHREGFENVRLSGSVNYAKRKKAFRLASESKKQKIELSGFYALKGKGGIGKLVSKLPFPGFEKVNVKVKVTTGKKNKIVLSYTKGGKKKTIRGDLTFTANSLAINLKTPFNGFQRMRANAGRTTAVDGKVSAQLSLNRNNREIAVKYTYLFSLKTGDGSIEIATPYEGFEDMRMSLTYNNEANLRNMKFSARRNSREWNIETSRSWGRGTDETSLILSSPIESIRSLKVHRSFDIKNLAAMEYHASYERNGRKFVISGQGSLTSKGKKVSFDVTVQTPLEISQLSANVAYDFTRAPWSLNAGISAGPKYVTLLASLGKASGSINFKTSNPNLPTMDIDYTASISGRSEDVSANLVLSDGRRLSVTHTATFTPGDSSGSVKVESTTFGNRELKWLLSAETYRNRPKRYAAKIDYKSPDIQANLDASILTLSSRLHRKVDATFSFASDRFTRNIQLDATADLNNLPSLDVTANVAIDGKKYNLVIDREIRGAQRTLMVTFDGQRIKGLKIVGTSSSEPGRLGGQRNISVTYGRGGEEMSLEGRVDLGSSGKSGSVELLLKTPLFSRGKSDEIKLKTTWSFVLPNRRIEVDWSVNGVGYVATFSGSRYDEKADYILQVSFPSIKVTRQKSISGIVVAMSYDISDGVFAKVNMDQPFEGTAEINFKQSRVETTLKALVGLNDKLDISPKIDSHRFNLNYKNTRLRTGSKIQASLDTTAFELGKIEVTADVQKRSDGSSINVNYKRGRKTAQIVGEISRAPGFGSSTFSLKAPITGFEDVSFAGSYQYSPGQQYALNVDYSRGGKYFRLDSSSVVSIKKAKGKLKSASSQTNIKVSSMIRKPIELSVTADASIKDVGTPKQSGTGKFEGTLNGKKVGLTYTVDRDEHGRRIGSIVLTTPLKRPYNKIVMNSDVSLHSNKAVLGVQLGPKKLSADVSWFLGEAGQYGAELSLTTPYAVLRTLELEARGTLNRDRSVDVLVHYQRNGKMAHVTGNVRPYAVDLTIETPDSGNFRVEGGVVINRREKAYSIRGLVTSLAQGTSAGGEITVKAAALNDMQLTVDVQTPLSGWERFNVDLAYTAVPNSRVVRVAFESPQTKRVEVSLELTNRSSRGRTDLRAGLTTNYLGSAFTFWTHIFRDSSGMKYELELESPYHISLPLLPANH